MGVRVRTTVDLTKKMEKACRELNGKKIQVGVIEGEHQWLAGIHEYGCTVTAKRSQYLTVPLVPEAKGRKARDFEGLFVYRAKSGNKFLARKKGKGLECVYWLTRSVKIPERAFLRNGYEMCKDGVLTKAEMMAGAVIGGKMQPSTLYKSIGQTLSTKIKAHARTAFAKNSPVTTAAKQKSTPLSDTGAMLGGLTWQVKK